ncbi:MAG TPA: multidrug efflux SMR transporter [Solirubrobacteraceae bacterium]|nr:multidrug efflux SMR transporter [Solirubrobacteraceae bacterium]
MKMAWALLIAAGLLEIVWALALKDAEGFSRLWPSVIGITAAWISFGLLTLALRTLPVGTAYAVWTGIGVLGVAVVGILAYGDSSSAARLALLAMILTGIIGLKVVE